jgi:DNA-binding GntR family transcriptional regulator
MRRDRGVVGDFRVANLAVKQEKKPRYLELADRLRRDILNGKFAQPLMFPTESELCEQHGVSRFTVRGALRKLQDEGLISRRRGSGTLIQPAAARGGALHQPLSNVGELLQYARDTRIALKPLGESRIPREHAEQIGTDPNGIWYRFRGIRNPKGGGKPIAVTDAYVHRDLAEAAKKIKSWKKAMFEQLAELTGVTVARVTQDIQAVPADADIGEELGVEEHSPCLRIMRCYLDRGGRIFEISVSHHPGDRFAYAMHIEVDS